MRAPTIPSTHPEAARPWRGSAPSAWSARDGSSLGPSDWLMTVAFLVVGAGMVALGVGLRRSLTPGPRVWAAWLITVTAVCFVGVAVFPTDAPLADGTTATTFPTDAPLADGTTATTFSGQTHAFASTVGPLFLVVGAFVLRGVFARDHRWHPLARVTGRFAVAMTLWYLISGTVVVTFGPGSYAGVVQRLFWLVLLERSSRTAGPRSRSGPREQHRR